MTIQNVDAEALLLGAALQSTKAWHRVSGIVRPEDFATPQHRAIAMACESLKNRDADYVEVGVTLSERGEAPEPGYLNQLALHCASSASIESHAGVVADFAKRRRIRELCGSIVAQAATTNADDLLAMLNPGLESISRRRQGKVMSLSEVIDAAEAAAKRARASRDSGKAPGVPTGIQCIDARTGGLQRQRLIVIAARPSLGKTALLNQIGLHAASRGHAGLICSLEMGPEQLGTRAMAMHAGVNVTRLSLGYKEEFDAACEACGTLGALPLYIDHETYTLSGICAQISEYRRTHKIQWAAVDHIGLVEADGYSTRNDQMGAISRTFKKLAKRLDIPIVALSQLNRSVEKDRRRPILADLRDSGNVEQDADIALFLHTEADDTTADIPMQLGLLKNRDGRRGWIKQDVTFSGATQTFSEPSITGDFS